jgi:citronellol/citronellal dehydrogenase
MSPPNPPSGSASRLPAGPPKGPSSLRGKTLFITGASRGIGKAIGLRAARDGASVVIAAKTAEPHPKLPGTIHTAAAEIEAAGGRALALVCDIRFEDQIAAAVAKAVETFGGIDILVNNASAISLTGTLATPMKRFDLMHQINTRGTYACSQACIPHLKKAANPHILNLSPPLNMEARWFAPHVAYTMAKFGMSMCVLGMAEELRGDGIAVNALWPRTVIATAAVQNLLGGDETVRRSRKPDIMGDAAHVILTRPSREFTGNFCIDDDVLASAGITDLSPYAHAPGAQLLPDFFI